MNSRIFVTSIVLMILSAMTLKSQTPYTRTFSIDDTTPTSAGWAYWFIPAKGGVTESINVKMSCVTNGSSTHGGHRHAHNEMFILVEGEAIINLDGKDIILKPWDQVLCPGGSEHSIRRSSLDKPIRYLMVNTSLSGLEVRPVTMRGRKIHNVTADGGQLIYLVTEGTANITVNGNAVQLPAMSVCYTPAGSASSIASAGGKMSYLLIKTD